MALQDALFRPELKEAIIEFFQLNEGSVATWVVLWNVFKAYIRGICISKHSGVLRDICRSLAQVEAQLSDLVRVRMELGFESQLHQCKILLNEFNDLSERQIIWANTQEHVNMWKVKGRGVYWNDSSIHHIQQNTYSKSGNRTAAVPFVPQSLSAFKKGTLTACSRLLCLSADSTLCDVSAPPEGALSCRLVFSSAFPSVWSRGYGFAVRGTRLRSKVDSRLGNGAQVQERAQRPLSPFFAYWRQERGGLP
ncbi:hypothetical protein NDU88_007166 [Pleurodeles waltl]|uniref:Uncharacterized protein n=1 Tax=Pleurodeles waltl TaxID=8319 RepID=A0AAV7VTI9_PLEWA|nr:hypothetical protein NDU88_007166 [Pleurodeles waltl]